MINDVTDVLVVGAGPAGAVAAVVLARAGLRVRVIDRARFPRPKLCGDSINPGALSILERLGLAEAVNGGLAVDGMIVTSASGVTVRGAYGGRRQGRMITREAFDAALVSAACRAGAVVNDGVLAQSPSVENGRVVGVVAGRSGRCERISARLVIAADGSSSRLARSLGLARHANHPRRWAVGAYFDDVDGMSSFGEMHLSSDRYVGIAPLPGRITNVCIVTPNRLALRDPVALLNDTLRSDPRFSTRFARARRIGRPVCLGPLAVESSADGMPGLLLAGDAAGFVDPMTGDGLRFALRGGELAALAAIESLNQPREAAYLQLAAMRRREFRTKVRFNRSVRMLTTSPHAMGLASWGAHWAPGIVERAVRYAGDVGL